MRAPIVLALTLLVSASASAAEPDPRLCKRFQTTVDGYARTLPPSRTLLRLTPVMTDKVMRDLLVHTKSGPPERIFDTYVALGVSRQGEGLRQLLKGPSVAGGEMGKLGRAIALIALGDGSMVSTIESALVSGQLPIRRAAARALSRMRHNRPLALLYNSMQDEDEEVRLWAARNLIRVGSKRALRTLKSLATSGNPEIKKRAARTLVDYRIRLGVDLMNKLPEPMRSRAIVSEAVRGYSAARRRVARDCSSQNANHRAAAYAALAHYETPYKLQRLSRAAVRRFGKLAEAEQLFAMALSGDEDVYADLDKLNVAQTARAAAVLWAFTGAGKKESRLPAEQATKLAAVVGKWLDTKALSPRDASRALRALEILDPEVAVLLVRDNMAQLEEWGLRSGVRILARHGEPQDLLRLLKQLSRKLELHTQAEIWRAGVRICQR